MIAIAVNPEPLHNGAPLLPPYACSSLSVTGTPKLNRLQHGEPPSTRTALCVDSLGVVHQAAPIQLQVQELFLTSQTEPSPQTRKFLR
jgi:hypothetical protein